MTRIIRGIGDLRIAGVSVGQAEYQVELAQGLHGFELRGKLSGSPPRMSDLVTGAEVTIHPPSPKTALRIQVQSVSVGSRSVDMLAWPLDIGIHPSKLC